MVVSITGIGSLPNELLINALSTFPTRELLPIASTSHRFHDLIIRIIHHRLIAAASLKNHKLILECFHPINKLSTPYTFCDYLGTDGLSNDVAGEGDIYKDVNETGRLGKMAGLYSHFRPVQPEDRIVWRRQPTGGALPDIVPKSQEQFISQNIDLDSYEVFSQLQTITNLVKVGPKRGLFMSSVNIGEGTLRVWRHWLADRAAANEKGINTPEEYENRVLWADASKHVGLRLRVTKRKEVPAPILQLNDEDAPVSYKVGYEELVIKTTQLLLNVEESLTREVENSGKAIVIGSWDY